MNDLSCVYEVIEHIDEQLLSMRDKVAEDEKLKEFIETRNQCLHIQLSNNEMIKIVYSSDSNTMKRYRINGRTFWKVGPLVIETPKSIKDITKEV